jgi:endonuclease-3
MRAIVSPDATPDTTRLATMIKKLERAYGVPRWQPTYDPLGELIATILSQNTSDVNSDRAYAALRTAYPTWEAALQAAPDELAAVIRSGGLATLKSQRIQAILRALKAGDGGLSLDFLKHMPMPAARAFLAEFPGVGPKTIACVLLFACGHPAFPVDTHIHRVTTRLGLLPAGCTAERAHTVLEPGIPPHKVYSAHVNLIRHGRSVCQARRPDCQHCCLRRSCPYPQHLARSHAGGEGRSQTLAAFSRQREGAGRDMSP